MIIIGDRNKEGSNCFFITHVDGSASAADRGLEHPKNAAAEPGID